MFIIAYSVGAILVKINASQADFIKKDFETKIKGINQYGIFANNFKVALADKGGIPNSHASSKAQGRGGDV